MDKSHLTCDHYGGSRHTKEGLFILFGYLDTWEDLKQKNVAAKFTQADGKAQFVTIISPSITIPQPHETDEEPGQSMLFWTCMGVTQQGSSPPQIPLQINFPITSKPQQQPHKIQQQKR